ncbi:MAG: hypothetical protein V4590_02350 [Bacteroidota bacterium]
MSFAAEYSLWFTLLCLLLAGAGSWFLYAQNKLDLSGKYGKWVERGLVAFRFLSLFCIAFLLLGPLMKLWTTRTDKPIIVVALDGSQSIAATKDSAFYRNTFVPQLQQLQQRLGDDYDVQSYTFGKEMHESLNNTFSERQTNMADVFSYIHNTYSNQNLGAVILAGDGLYNDGSNPVYETKDLNAPVYTIGLGDTIQRKDVLIKQVKHNQLVYAGNLFPLQIDVLAYGFANRQTMLTVSQNGKVVYSTAVTIQDASFFATIPVSLEAKQPGTQHYVVSLAPLAGEVSTANNRFDVFINVIDGKQKIALVSLAPHPDITAFKQSIEQNENYSIVALPFDKISSAQLKDFSLILFHQLPGLKGEGLALVKAAREQGIPVLYVVGAQTGLSYLNSAEPALTLSANRNSTNETTPNLEPSFALFMVSEEDWSIIKKFPPLYSPYASYNINVEHDVLFTQQIGYVKTQFPLIAFGKSTGNKTGFVFGEGFWKWRMYDAALSEHRATSSLMGKMVQYLAAKDDRSRFRVTGKKRFDENESIKLDAEVYNESYELINSGDVQLTLLNAAGKKFTYTFSKTDKAYTLDLGLLLPGNYSYEATTTVGPKTQVVKGQFAVIPLQVEFLQTTAKHQLLHDIGQETGGALFYPNQLEALEKAVRSNEIIKPVIYKQETVKSWINLKWICFVILGLLTGEWFVRKWNGSI